MHDPYIALIWLVIIGLRFFFRAVNGSTKNRPKMPPRPGALQDFGSNTGSFGSNAPSNLPPTMSGGPNTSISGQMGAPLGIMGESPFGSLDDLAPNRNAAAHPEILALVQRGQKIQAIKRWRELTGAGLREAKDAVEAVERGMRF